MFLRHCLWLLATWFFVFTPLHSAQGYVVGWPHFIVFLASVVLGWTWVIIREVASNLRAIHQTRRLVASGPWGAAIARERRA